MRCANTNPELKEKWEDQLSAVPEATRSRLDSASHRSTRAPQSDRLPWRNKPISPEEQARIDAANDEYWRRQKEYWETERKRQQERELERERMQKEKDKKQKKVWRDMERRTEEREEWEEQKRNEERKRQEQRARDFEANAERQAKLNWERRDQEDKRRKEEKKRSGSKLTEGRRTVLPKIEIRFWVTFHVPLHQELLLQQNHQKKRLLQKIPLQ